MFQYGRQIINNSKIESLLITLAEHYSQELENHRHVPERKRNIYYLNKYMNIYLKVFVNKRKILFTRMLAKWKNEKDRGMSAINK
jgi:hypothetical protein